MEVSVVISKHYFSSFTPSHHFYWKCKKRKATKTYTDNFSLQQTSLSECLFEKNTNQTMQIIPPTQGHVKEPGVLQFPYGATASLPYIW